ncbi:MAG: DUF1329 domain-containing protein, partial [Gallionella sp.]|nr:DUF1329 domain-containing protein [Gallionella sp.]
MSNKNLTLISAALALVFSVSFVSSACAEVSAAVAAKLGKSLTPLGAEMAGNAANTIPAWDGGITKPAAGYKEGGHYPDPYAGDKPLFTIDAASMEKYKANLTPGQMALLKKYPDWKMNVYPGRRSAAFPKGHYDETAANATKVKLAPAGNGITGAKGGIPFPIPKDGLEVVWNHLTRYRGDTYGTNWSQAAVTREGDYTLVRFEYEYDFHYGNLARPDKDREDNKLFNFLQAVTAPARLAGQILLVHEYADQVKQPRQAWTYNPGQRRVRLAPNVAYDNPGTAADGLRTNDDFLMYNGATDRYNWKLVGKQEIYVPYNSYKLVGNSLKPRLSIRNNHPSFMPEPMQAGIDCGLSPKPLEPLPSSASHSQSQYI